MSLILDALRKSEAERRRGQVPDLHAELPPLVRVAPPPRRRWPAWFAGVAVLLAAGALGWSLWASRSPVAAGTVATSPPANDPMPSSVDAPPLEASPTRAPPRDPVASTASRKPERPVAGEVQPIAATPQAPTAAAEAPPTAPAAPEPPVAVPDPARYEPAIAAATAVATPPAPIPAVAPPMPASGDTVRLADLSPGEREQLPALKISMHMWGATPAQRFAIIDGARVGQGDRVGEAVVEEIAADGVVLNWHGRRLALPLR